jgi:hypothetical protein
MLSLPSAVYISSCLYNLYVAALSYVLTVDLTLLVYLYVVILPVVAIYSLCRPIPVTVHYQIA